MKSENDDQAKMLRERAHTLEREQMRMQSLPPRSRIHKRQSTMKRKNKRKLRFRFVLIRLFLLLFFLLIIAAFALPKWI